MTSFSSRYENQVTVMDIGNSPQWETAR